MRYLILLLLLGGCVQLIRYHGKDCIQEGNMLRCEDGTSYLVSQTSYCNLDYCADSLEELEEMTNGKT